MEYIQFHLREVCGIYKHANSGIYIVIFILFMKKALLKERYNMQKIEWNSLMITFLVRRTNEH
ncbi:MAG TPA: hypothetical protein VN704_07750 [Verrucomicrobiae bacterium]|nr:hypothetical protein [Verrucomicrobiae bacterium]